MQFELGADWSHSINLQTINKMFVKMTLERKKKLDTRFYKYQLEASILKEAEFQ